MSILAVLSLLKLDQQLAHPDIAALQHRSLAHISTDQRSVWDILWSCMVTIFACTWVSVHPNMASSEDGSMFIALRRIELMIWGILTPEMIIFWALRQWLGARKLAMKYGKHGWTTTHGHFIQMGGFMLMKDGREAGVLCPHRMEELLNDRMIEFPKIEEKEILDRSKGDGLSKGLVIAQTSWFIAQCLSRKAIGLYLTEIELITLAFAVLNGGMYFLWWNKPIDVRCPVPVNLLPPSEAKDIDIQYVTPPRRAWSGLYLSERELVRSTFDSYNENTTESHTVGDYSSYNESCESLAFEVNYEAQRRKGSKVKMALLFIFRRLADMRNLTGKIKPIKKDRRAMPTFYAYGGCGFGDILICHTVISITGTIFGAIHCAGWFFEFPSYTETIIWRVSAILITTLPSFVLFWNIFLGIYVRNDWFFGILAKVFWIIFLIFLPAYLLARIALLTEGFLALRNLPSGAYDVVAWTSFLPHI